MQAQPPDLFERMARKQKLWGGPSSQWLIVALVFVVLSLLPLVGFWSTGQPAALSTTAQVRQVSRYKPAAPRSIRTHGFGGSNRSSGRSHFGGGSSIH